MSHIFEDCINADDDLKRVETFVFMEIHNRMHWLTVLFDHAPTTYTLHSHLHLISQNFLLFGKSYKEIIIFPLLSFLKKFWTKRILKICSSYRFRQNYFLIIIYKLYNIKLIYMKVLHIYESINIKLIYMKVYSV